jgi:hypothetical protein
MFHNVLRTTIDLRHTTKSLNLLFPHPPRRTVNMLSRPPASFILTLKVRTQPVVPVQLKAVHGRDPLYMVFYLLTLPGFAVRVGEKPW